MSMLRKLRTITGGAPPTKTFAPVAAKQHVLRSIREKLGSVSWSEDFQRVLELPRRAQPDLNALVEEMTARLKRPEGTQKLRPHQAWALWEAPQVGGLLAQLSVGRGKTLIGLLAAMVMENCKRAVLFIPPSLRAQLMNHDLEHYGKHWVLPNIAGGDKFVAGRPVLHVVAYSELSHKKSTALLEQIDADLYIFDEIQNLKAPKAVKTGRVLRSCMSKPDIRGMGWSGTLTSNSVRDFAHLGILTLGAGAPVPAEESVVNEWAAVIDPDGTADAGMLRKFCEPGEATRVGFRRRLTDTPGFIATAESDIGASIVFYERPDPVIPDKIKKFLRELRRPPREGGWKRPDGEEFTTALAVRECARQLACGVYLRWRYPRGEPPEVIDEWFSRRQSWNREVRAKLETPFPHLDSPDLAKSAAARWYNGGCTPCHCDEPGVKCYSCHRGPEETHKPGCKEAVDHPLWASRTYLPWIEVEKTVHHEQEVVWVSDYLMQEIAEWMREAPGLVWTEHTAVGHMLAKLTGCSFYSGGKRASDEILKEDGSKTLIMSIDAHRTGHNLQAYHRNLIISFPASAEWVEQALGRSHRDGQKAGEVSVEYFSHTSELKDSFQTAKDRAKYIHEILGSHQKMAYGSFVRGLPVRDPA